MNNILMGILIYIYYYINIQMHMLCIYIMIYTLHRAIYMVYISFVDYLHSIWILLDRMILICMCHCRDSS